MPLIQESSAAVSESVLYSASVDDLATESCRLLADQEIRFDPRNVQKPPVDLLVY